MTKKKKNLVTIVGPTAVGKTALAIKLASLFNTEIISADSRQVYKEMEIGTAKPSKLELSQVKHHFINSHSIYEDFSAGKFEEEGLKVLNEIFKTKNIAIMVGGSGLYVDAICKGMDNIPKDAKIREDLMQQLQNEGLEKLQQQLIKYDPEYYEIVDKENPQRIIRALEVCILTGSRYSTLRTNKEVSRDFNVIKIGLELPRDVLYKRIDLRMDLMIEEGLFEEAENLFQLRHLNALQTVGYTEIFDYLEGKHNKDEAIRLLKRNSRRYAKRQLTWFRRDTEIRWFNLEEIEEENIRKFITENIESSTSKHEV